MYCEDIEKLCEPLQFIVNHLKHREILNILTDLSEETEREFIEGWGDRPLDPLTRRYFRKVKTSLGFQRRT